MASHCLLVVRSQASKGSMKSKLAVTDHKTLHMIGDSGGRIHLGNRKQKFRIIGLHAGSFS